MITEKQGDVFVALEGRRRPTVFFHGCNMQGVMGAGVALGVKNKWPYVYKTYRNFCKDPALRVELGGVVMVPHTLRGEVGELPLTVANGFTQEGYGTGEVQATLPAIVSVLEGLSDALRDKEGWDFVSVRVGCGLGGLEWESVRPLFEQSDLNWTVYYQ